MKGVWLDTPLIDVINGEGTIEREFAAMYRNFNKFGIDIRKEPMLGFPTLHYQNGGVEINVKCETKLPGLFAAGEVCGGIHGKTGSWATVNSTSTSSVEEREKQQLRE